MWTVTQITEWVGGTIQGDGAVRIASVASLDSAGPDALTFAVDAKRLARLADSRAGAALVSSEADAPDTVMPLIRVPDVPQALLVVLEHLAGEEDLPPVGVDETAVVASDVELGAGVRIGPGVVIAGGVKIGPATALCAGVKIGQGVRIGQNSVLCQNVVVRQECCLGDRVRIGPNSVIGYDGFGYQTIDGVHRKIPHVGNVVIEDDVELGACACVDRAKFGSTRIGAGSKIDNLVQVAHNVQIARGCVIAALSGIAGSTQLGAYVVLGGHVGLRDNIVLGSGVTAGAFSAIAGDVPDGQTVAGIPASPANEARRQWMAVRKLPELLKRVKVLEAKLKTLASSKNH